MASDFSDSNSFEPVAHHPAVLLVLERVPRAEARVLRLYMDLLLQTVESFSQRGRAMRAERDALLDVLRGVTELAEFIEAAASEPSKADAQREAEALLATVRKNSRKGERS